ncbi:MAG: hypothetical protein U5K75_03000 [Ahrensia sp.]|nr:hypothetical protein [Ahrensia sp.]
MNEQTTPSGLPNSDGLYRVSLTYTAFADAEFGLPEGKTWHDVESYGVKWSTIYITFKDGTQHEDTLYFDIAVDNLDTKRPTSISIEQIDDNYDVVAVLSEQG